MRKMLVQDLISAALAWMLLVSAIGSLVTGYDLPACSMAEIVLWCGAFALGFACLFRFRYGGWAAVALSALVLYLLWKKEALWQQIQLLGWHITTHYHDVYNWPVLGSANGAEMTLPLILWAALTAACVNWYLCRRKHIVTAMIPVVLPLALCLITTDRVPEGKYLYLMILGLSVLLLSDWTRRVSADQGRRLVLRATLPMAVFLALIFLGNPREQYVNRAGTLQKAAVSWLQELQGTAEAVVSGTPVDMSAGENISLQTVGPKSDLSYAVMRIHSPVGGTVYLRGRDYDAYTGTGWKALPDRREVFPTGTAFVGNLTIVTYGIRDVLYVPYYGVAEIRLEGGVCENKENLQRYSYALSPGAAGKSPTPGARYLELPEDTFPWAVELSGQITAGAFSEQEIITRIQSYVRDCAAYDLSTPRMDSRYSDFARWFLEESETGYCVHFATAATVLLRASGIPARYVEGYAVACEAGSDVVVSSLDAHAWAEYYDGDSGVWRILEATPADPEDVETESLTTVPETTQPETQSPSTGSMALEDTATVPAGQESEHPGHTTEDAGEQDKEHRPFRIPSWVKIIFRCILITACLPLQAWVRIRVKRTLWNRGTPNEQAMSRWRQTRSLAKLLKQPYPQKLEDLAKKAVFSREGIRAEELESFDSYRHSLTELLRGKPWYQRCLFRWILAIR